MKYFSLIVIKTFGVLTANAQKPKDNQMAGYIIMADGTRSEVGLEVEDASQPWTYQDGVKYFDKNLLTGGRIKRELKKVLMAGEVVEYGFGNKKYVHIHYLPKTKGSDAIKTTMDKIKGEKNMEFFAEVIRDGDIRLLRFYQPPIITDEDYDNPESIAEMTKESIETYDILIDKVGEKAKSIEEINYKSFFEGCSFVTKKFEDKRYKIQPSSGIKKLLKSDSLSGIRLENAANAILDDYQQKCGKK